MEDYFQKYRNWQYKNTALLILSLIALFYLVGTRSAQNLIDAIGNFGYIGAFLVGILFVSTFTVGPAMVILYHLATKFNPFEVAMVAGLGAVLGDYLIFRFFKDRVFEEIKPMFEKFHDSFLGSFFRTPFFIWLLPLVGAAIIASPFPDELGIGLLGLSKMKNWQFLVISFLLNAVGIFVVVTIARSF